MEKLLIGGFAGAGKTRVAREVAELLGRTFLDLDEEISEGEGKTVQQIIGVDGIDCFRQLEVTYFNKISSQNNLVLSLGGGSLENQEIRENVKRFDKSIWICQQSNTLSNRLESDSNKRPLVEGTPEELRINVSELLLSRLKNYQTLETRVWAGNATIGQIAACCIESQKETVVLGSLGKPLLVGHERSERVDALNILGAILQNDADQYLLQDSGKISKELLTAVYDTNRSLLNSLYGLYCIGNYKAWESAFTYGKNQQESDGSWIMEELISAAFSNGSDPYVIGTNLNLIPGSSAKHLVFNALACALKAVRSGISDLTTEHVTTQIMKLIELAEIDKEEHYSVDEESMVTSSGSKATRFELCYRYLKAPAYLGLFRAGAD